MRQISASSSRAFRPPLTLLIREAYSGKTPVETLVMAERFRDGYLQTFMLYSNKFVLDDFGKWSEIVDSDMEQRRPAQKNPRCL